MSDLKGNSIIQGDQIKVYVFVHTSFGIDLDTEFVDKTNEIIQTYFDGTSIILKIGEIPFELEDNYSFKMIIHY